MTPLKTHNTESNQRVKHKTGWVKFRGLFTFDGVFAVGALVHDHTNQVAGAISACGLKLERSSSDLLALGKLVKRYAIRLSEELGASQDEESPADAF